MSKEMNLIQNTLDKNSGISFLITSLKLWLQVAQIAFYIHSPNVCHLNASKFPDIWNFLTIKGEEKAEHLGPGNVTFYISKDSWRRGTGGTE